MCARNDREDLDRANPGQHIGFTPIERGHCDLWPAARSGVLEEHEGGRQRPLRRKGLAVTGR
jgi:hypothetical protein